MFHDELDFLGLQTFVEIFQEIFDREPLHVDRENLEIWRELGPLNLQALINEGKITLNGNKI